MGTKKEKEKEELKKDRSPGKVHRWLRKKDHQDPGKRSFAAGGKDQYREKLISCWTQRTPLGALSSAALVREGIQKTYEVRAVVFQFLESTRSGTPREPWMKGEPTPAWDHGSRGSSPFWLGEGRVPSGNVATPELVVLVLRNLDSCEQEGGVRLGKQHRVPLHPH